MPFISSRTGAPMRHRVMAVAGIAAAALFTTTAAHASQTEPQSGAARHAVMLGADDVQLESLGTDDQVLAGLEGALKLIDQIPDEVLAQGEGATGQWLSENSPAKATGGIQKRSFSATGCARGILLAVGSNIFAIAKVYKVKKAIDKLGGVKKVVAKIRSKEKKGKTFKKGLMEVFEEAGGGLGGIAAEILGVDGVIKHCW